MAILSFRKLIASIFIFLSIAGLLFTSFGLLTGDMDENVISKFIIFSVILGVAYYMGYIYLPEKSLSLDSATCDALLTKNRTGGSSSSNYSAGLYEEDRKPGSGENQVFNISQNIFRYDQAEEACKKFDSTVATVNQVKQAYRKGANWCNYGWTQGGYALYPIQPGYFNSIQSNPQCKWSCGNKPGLVGGKMNSKFTLGVNCYGVPPKQTKKNVLKCQQEDVAADNIINNLTADHLMANSFN